MGEFDGQRVTVMGLGRFGGGLGVARWVAGQGADALVTDLGTAETLSDSIRALEDLIEAGAVSLRLGEHNIGDFTTCDLVIANPAVTRPWENRFLRAAHAAGVPITTEIQLLVERLPSRELTVGVTGTAGKSTTAAMTAHILRESGRLVHLGGNIGGSLLGELAQIDSHACVVLELSSAQLHWISGWSPGIAVATNFAPNHLDWHETVAHYAESKQRLFRWQEPGDAALLGAGAEDWPVNSGVEPIAPVSDVDIPPLLIPGRHNRRNAAVAVAAAVAVGNLNGSNTGQTLGTYRGLPHRLRLVAEFGGVRYYDDSKSTTPEAAILAIGAFADERPAPRVHLIAGGYDKGADLSPLGRACAAVAHLYTIGLTGNSLAEVSDAGATHRCGTLDAAIAHVHRHVRAGDIVVLSPGCASWDQFDNYEARGRAFAQSVADATGQPLA